MTELLTTERTYVQGLTTLCDVFYNPIRLTPKFLLVKQQKSGKDSYAVR